MSTKVMLKQIVSCAALCASLALPAQAQNLFETVVSVNDSVITEYEISQRIRFLQLLNAPGGTRKAVIAELIDDRLKTQAAEEVGLSLNEVGIQAGMDEFSARVNLSTEEFIRIIEGAGVSKETYQAFVNAGILWREVVQDKFGANVQISESDIDRAMGNAAGSANLKVLLSEIIIPAPPPKAAQAQVQAEQAAGAKSISEFSAFARKYSATASRGRGGRLDWVNLSDLPPNLAAIVQNLSVGEVTNPLPIPGAIALFQLREIKELKAPAKKYSAIEYAVFYIPGGRSQEALAAAKKLRRKVDVCDDLYGAAKGLPENMLERKSLAPSDIPQDVAIELAKLDRNEISTNLTRASDQALKFVMLCGRTAELNGDADRSQVADSLRQQQMLGYANSYLSQLRSQARILHK